MSPSILQTLSKFIAADILKQPARPILPTDKLISSGLIDSFSLVDLSIFVENTFGVHIDDTELTAETFDTLEQLAGLIEQRQA
jgi:acyl carrier protein